MNHKDFKIDPGHTKDMGGKRGGIVGETHIWDCLLYTSPSPRDRQKSRMPSSA